MREEKTTENDTNKKTETDNSVKVTVARELAEGLGELTQKVNDGFAAGWVYRQDVASWIIAKFLKNYSDSDVQQIREAHYNDATMLDVLYRKSKETGELPEFLRDALRKHFRNLTEHPKKSKKTLTNEYINDVHLKHEDTA